MIPIFTPRPAGLRAALVVVLALAVLAVGVLPAAAQPRGERPDGFGLGHGMDRGLGHGIGHAHGLGGERHGFPVRRLVRALDLTDEQVEQTRALLEELAETQRPVREQLRVERDALRTALDEAIPDATRIGEIVLGMETLRDQLKASRDGFVADFEALLTPEQLERFEEIRNRRDRLGSGAGVGLGL